jgi:hypothetical protein
MEIKTPKCSATTVCLFLALAAGLCRVEICLSAALRVRKPIHSSLSKIALPDPLSQKIPEKMHISSFFSAFAVTSFPSVRLITPGHLVKMKQRKARCENTKMYNAWKQT